MKPLRSIDDQSGVLFVRLVSQAWHGWGLRPFTVNGRSGWISTPPPVASRSDQ